MKHFNKKKEIIFALIALVIIGLGIFYFDSIKSLASFVVNRSQENSLNSGLVLLQSYNGDYINWTTVYSMRDSSGSGNHGDPRGVIAEKSVVVGKVGQALKFNGVVASDGINHTNSGSLQIVGDITIAFWVKPGETQLTNAEILAKVNAASGYAVEQSGTSNNNFYFTWGNGSFTCNTASDVTVLTPNEWQYVVFSKSGAVVTHYKDGIVTNSCTGSGSTIGNPAVDLYIGQYTLSNTRNFNGVLDDVRIYNRALSFSEASQLYQQSGGVAVNRTPKDVLTDGLVMYHTFDGKDIDWAVTSSTRDASGNNNHGAPSGMSQSNVVAGKIGQGLAFNGTNSFILTPSISFSDVFTVSLWVNWTSTPSDVLVGDPDDTRYFMFVNATNIATRFDAGNVANIAHGGISRGQWYHLVVTRDASNLVRAYKNGNLLSASGTVVGTLILQSLGGNPVGNFPLGGKMDEVRVYNRALSQVEVNQLYQQGGGITVNRSQNNDLSGGLVLMQSFNGGDIDWTVTSSTRDKSGQNNHGDPQGSLNNNLSSVVMGKIGQALRFNGGTDQIKIRDSDSVDITGDISVTFWVKPSDSQVANADILSKYQTVGEGGYTVEQSAASTNQFYFGWGNGTALTCATLSDTMTLNSNVWQFVVFSKSGAVVTHYKDGVQTNSCTGSYSAISANTNDLHIGSFSLDGTQNFRGIIDEVRIYDRALSLDEVKLLYNNGK